LKVDFADLNAFAVVAQAKGFREGARATGLSASALSDGVRRLESHLGVRLLNRTTRSVNPTEVGVRLLERLRPALAEMESALEVVNGFREKPAGRLRLNVPVSVAAFVLPTIVPAFIAAYPDIQVELVVNQGFVDVIEEGCDAGIRYEERLEQDMIAVPVGPRSQRFATAASSAYLDRAGRPKHPRELLEHACICSRYPSGMLQPWHFERKGKTLRINPSGPLIVSVGQAVSVAVQSAVAGTGIVHLFEAWIQPYIDSGELEPILESWWQSFSGPYLYYPGRRLVPAPLRAFIDFLKTIAD
jgi:DNA-binding transcriptional LysR family regulator